jgi:hypothetical protein
MISPGAGRPDRLEVVGCASSSTTQVKRTRVATRL